jgi:nucleoside-diphosphate-sugar epimerase
MRTKILITGAGGFLGGRTAKHFASQYPDYSVIASSRRNDRQEELNNHGCNFVQGDLCDLDFCIKTTREVDIIVHCAALSAPFGEYQNFYKANFIATKNLLEAAQENQVKKFIFISTPSIYYNFNDRYNVKESDELPKRFVNAYAETKLMAEQLVLSKNNLQFKTLALRPRAIIGAEDTVILPRILEAYSKGRLKIIGDGKNICDLTCAVNVITAIEKAIEATSEAYGEAYNITDNESINFWDAVNYTLTSLGHPAVRKKIPKFLASVAASVIEQHAKIITKKEPVLTKYGVGLLHQNFTLNIDKAKSKLNYTPKMSTYEGINEYIAWSKQIK